LEVAVLERNAQKRLSKHPRGHRVPIFLDVENFGATPKEQIPFVVAVLAQLSGDSEQSAKNWANQKPQAINRNNFESVLAKIRPKLAFAVANKLHGAQPGDQFAVNLEFESTQDFEPTGVARKIPALNRKLILRQRLRELQSLLITDKNFRSELDRLFRQEGSRKQMLEAISGLLNAKPAQGSPQTTP
jgi:type VI secretion system protein ImpB